MGARGPKPGSKAAKAEAQAPAVEASPAPAFGAARDNYRHMSGEALAKFAHQAGLPRSEIDRSTEEHIKRQLDSLSYRRFEDAPA